MTSNNKKSQKDILAERIGKILKIRRLEMGIKQREMASILGCSIGQISFYETGRNLIPLDVLMEACRVLNYDECDLLKMAKDGRRIEMMPMLVNYFPSDQDELLDEADKIPEE